MRCPVDGETLMMSERSGVEVDYCPKCRGVWLDRGELDKIISRGDARGPDPVRDDDVRPVRLAEPVPAARPVVRPDTWPDTARDDRQGARHHGAPRKHRDDDDDDDDRRHSRKRRESFLSDLFDF